MAQQHDRALALDPREEQYRIDSPHTGLRLFLRRLPSVLNSGPKRIVLYVHGATFPSGLSVAHRFDGRSWRDALCEAGFDVWALDFQGFGGSDRYREMVGDAEDHDPLCRTDDASEQLAAAVRFILEREGAPSLSLLAHSWGTMVAGHFAGAHSGQVDRLAFFAPITRRDGAHNCAGSGPGWRVITNAAQYARFVEDVPATEPPVLARRHFDDWAGRYLDSDPGSRARDPEGVKVPAGPAAEIARAWGGDLAYDPGRIRSPVAILRGEWDSLVTDADARWLWDALALSPIKRDVKIGRGTHLMHLESARLALWRESVAFLVGNDVAPMPN